MNNLFGKKQTVEETCKEAKRDINGQTRGLGREVQKLDRQEAELMKEIKKAAGKGDTATAKALGKQIVMVRQARDRLVGSKAQLGSLATKTTTMAAQHKQIEVMGKTAVVMGKMNKQMNPEQMAKIMQEFQMQNERMTVAQDLMDDAFDTLDDDDLDADTQDVMDQVLDEVCSDIKSSVSISSSTLPSRGTATATTTAQLNRNLAQ